MKSMTNAQKQACFAPLLKDFETDEFKAYFMDMVANIPDYIFSMPSSTTGKYHNQAQAKTYGQVYHEYMFASVLNHRLELKWNREKYSTPEIRDAMRCVPVFHDAVKCGWNGSNYTVPKHPLFAAEWVRNIKVAHDIPSNLKEMIANMCAAHSGQWNTGKTGKPIELNGEIMPEPRNDMEFFIHECDILSSRSDIEWTVPEELKKILKENVPVEDGSTYRITFGKYAEKTLDEIAALDPSYLVWIQNNLTLREPLRSLIKEYI